MNFNGLGNAPWPPLLASPAGIAYNKHKRTFVIISTYTRCLPPFRLDVRDLLLSYKDTAQPKLHLNSDTPDRPHGLAAVRDYPPMN